MNRIKFKKLLRQKTQCWIQHDWLNIVKSYLEKMSSQD